MPAAARTGLPRVFRASVLLLAALLAVSPSSPVPADVPATRPVGRPAPRPAAVAPATTQPTTRAVPDFGGEWETTYGPMRLRQTGDAVEGTYGEGGRAKVSGTVGPGGRLTFTYTEPNATGEGWFELRDAGRSFAGEWREKHAGVWAGWAGRRTGAAAETTDFTGLWQTTFGRVRLRQAGDAVTGTYEFNGRSSIAGKVEGRTLTFSYLQGDGERGVGTFELSADAQSIAGKWHGEKAGQPTAGGNWGGTRVLAQPGRVWLVVLEAPWEQNLADEEYSFGHMLRAYFARVPTVAVRHRALNSEADLKRWTSELPYFAEPVVLYIASHGTDKGIAVGGKTVGAKAIADCLKGADNVKLLHFGSCLVCAGGVPREIQNELGDAARFPISGFTRAADWGGSAVIDFTYLDLVLARKLPPVEAARQVRRMITFAGEGEAAGQPIPPAGLVIFEK
ncbi:MAG TPA: hypothetical protein VF796_30845 [Humisphaera sp.]